jgi:hypothetical protein
MKIALGNRRQLLLFGSLAVVLVLALVKMRGGSAAATASAQRPAASGMAVPGEEERPMASRGSGGRAEKKVNPDEVPIFTKRDLDSVGSRPQPGGRNIFDFRAPTLRPPPTPTPAPPPPPVCGDPRHVGPCPPPPPTPTPPPPEISFKFIGTFGPKAQPIAVLSQGGEIVNAREGEVVFGRFIVKKIGYESIDVGFVGWTDSRRLGLSP